MKNVLSAVLAVTLFASSALAAVEAVGISGVSGKIMIDTGKGFTATSGLASLKTGDRIFVGKDSSVTVAFEACSVTLDTPTVFVVPAKAACDASTAPIITPTADAYIAPTPFPYWIILAGGATVAIGCAVACGDLFGNDNGPSGSAR